jgi:hypothetical protein
MRIGFKSPKARGSQIIAGFVLEIGGFLLLVLAMPTAWPHRLLMALPVVFGVALSFAAESSLTRGVRKNKWPKELLAPLSRWFSHPILLVPTSLLAIGAVVYLFTSHFRHGMAGFWLACFPLMTTLRVRTLLKGPATNDLDQGLGLTDARPIHSETWGARGDGGDRLLSGSRD